MTFSVGSYVTMAYLCTLGFAYSKVQKQETEHLNSWVAK